LETAKPSAISKTEMAIAGWGPILSREDFLTIKQQGLLGESQIAELTNFEEAELNKLQGVIEGAANSQAHETFWSTAGHLLNLLEDPRALEPLVASFKTRVLSHLEHKEFDEATQSLRRIKEMSLLNSIPLATTRQLQQICGELVDSSIRQKLIGHLRGADKANPAAPGILDYLSMLPEDAAADLLDWLEVEEQRWLRRAICQLLSQPGSYNLPVLWRRLSTGKWYMARNVLSILGMINKPESLEHIASLLKHSNPQIRKEAIKSLGLSGDPVVFEWLVGVMKDADEQVQITAIEWMGILQEKRALPQLLEILNQKAIFIERTDLKIGAVQALANIGDPETIPHLKKLTRRSWFSFSSRKSELAAEAQKALDQIRKKRLSHERT
jgi:hypothetical protein